MANNSIVITTHYEKFATGEIAYARKSLIHRSLNRSDVYSLLECVKIIRDSPLECGQETLDHRYGSNLHVLYRNGFYFLYRWHKPYAGAYAKCKWLVHILDMGKYRTDQDDNKILDIYEDPDAIRTLSERDGELITDL